MVEATLEKGGELCIETRLKRSPLGLIGTDRSSAGLLVTIKAHPIVEEFMKQLGGGGRVLVGNVGRYWQPHHEDDPPLEAYNIPEKPLEVLKIDGVGTISFEKLGWPLELVNPKYGGFDLNMSFLRLVGISKEEGVSFLLKSVMSFKELEGLRDKIHTAQTVIYNAYMRPVEFTVTTSSQTLRS